MRTQTLLFSKGPMTRQAGLHDLLRNHEEQTIRKIKQISSMDQLTEAFLTKLVKDSVVDPLVLDFGHITRRTRTEDIDGTEFPPTFNVQRGKRYPKTVVRLSIPFAGDRTLLDYTPNRCSTVFPHGVVTGRAIEFDIILWGSEDDDRRVKEEIEGNIAVLTDYANDSARQVQAFNQALPDKVKSAFDDKLQELSRQHSIFDKLGIKEAEPEPEPQSPAAERPVQRPKESRQVQIIQYVEKMYVETLNQHNENQGNVNNAIQSD